MASARVKEMFQKYGRVAVAVHLSLYCTSLAGATRTVRVNGYLCAQ